MVQPENKPSQNGRTPKPSIEPPSWRTYLLFTIIPIVLSGLISWYIASNTASTTAQETTESLLKSERKKGDIVLSSIGYRYFMALVTSLNEETSEFNHKPSKIAYRKALKDIQEDIRWLHRNPLFDERGSIIDTMNRFHFRLSEELAHNGNGAIAATLEIACKEFVHSDSWRESVWAYQKNDDEHITNLLKRADEICEENTK